MVAGVIQHPSCRHPRRRPPRPPPPPPHHPPIPPLRHPLPPSSSCSLSVPLLILTRPRLITPPSSPLGICQIPTSTLLHCMFLHIPDHANSPGHRLWVGQWSYTKRLEL
eukprot:7260944-Pyramimonas_sp.AAC.1